VNRPSGPHCRSWVRVSWKRTPVSWAVRSASRNTTARRPCHRPARPRHPDLPPEVEVALLPTRPPWADRFDTRDEGERARYGVYALTRRAAEAAAVRAAATSLLDGHGQEGRLIVLGDLNDGPDAATTQILYGPPGSEIGTDGFDQADRDDGQRLWNLAARIPEAQRFSRVYRGRGAARPEPSPPTPPRVCAAGADRRSRSPTSPPCFAPADGPPSTSPLSLPPRRRSTATSLVPSYEVRTCPRRESLLGPARDSRFSTRASARPSPRYRTS
jgi:hypothetical protein